MALTSHEKDTCLQYESGNKKTVVTYLTSAASVLIRQLECVQID